jgi:hypothetical protein
VSDPGQGGVYPLDWQQRRRKISVRGHGAGGYLAVAYTVANSEDLLLKRALEALDTRELPYALDPRCWGGHGIGLGCDLCGLPISSSDIEIQAVADPYTATVRLHSLCYTQWQRACCESLG